jgi:hypothetical protein
VRSVDADKLMQPLAGDAKLVRPVGDVGCHLGVDLGWAVRGLYVRAFGVRETAAVEVRVNEKYYWTCSISGASMRQKVDERGRER